MEGVDVRYAQDAVDRDALAAEASKIAHSFTTPDGHRIASAGSNPTSTGIEVSVVVSEGERVDLQGIARSVQGAFATSAPVTVVRGGAIEAASRNLDSAPWNGGARISTSSATPGFVNTCTTGWGMGIISVPPNYRPVMLIADHCSGHDHTGATGVQWRTGHSLTSTIIGSSEVTVRHNADLQFITMDAGGSGLMFVGAPGSNSRALVKGAIAPAIGDYWCISGAESGTISSAEVVNTEQTVCYSITMCYDHHVLRPPGPHRADGRCVLGRQR